MKRRRWYCALGCLLCAGLAQSAYITDKLLTGLYENPSSSGKPIKLLGSGSALEVLESEGSFQRVRLADGVEGWVNRSYVTEDKPAQAMLQEAQMRISELEGQLAASASADCPEVDTAPAEVEAKDVEPDSGPVAVAPAQDCEDVQSRLEGLRRRVAEAAQLLGGEADQAAVPVTAVHADWRHYWPWFGMIAALLGGVFLGTAYVKFRVRQRFGGIQL